MVGALCHAIPPNAVPLAALSRRACIAHDDERSGRTLPCAASGTWLQQTREEESAVRDNMTAEDAIKVVHVLGCELASDGDEGR